LTIVAAAGSRPPIELPWMRGRRKLIDTAIANIHLTPEDVVFDVGAGDASLSSVVAARTGGRLLTTDLDQRACLSAHGCGVPVVRSDVRHLPVADGRSALTVAFEIIEHFPSWEAPVVVDELARVTRPDGRLLLSTPNRLSLESVRGLVNYLRHGTPWTARDETHRTIYTRAAVKRLLQPRFQVERIYGYWLVPDFRGKLSRWTPVVTAQPLLVGWCFLLLVVARRRP
jgi:SAM-dependent methyltransferase